MYQGGLDFSFSARTPTELSVADIADGRAVDHKISVFLVGIGEGLDFSVSARTPTEPGVADIADGHTVGRKSPSFWSASVRVGYEPVSASEGLTSSPRPRADGATCHPSTLPYHTISTPAPDWAQPPIGLSSRLKDYDVSVRPYQICGCTKSSMQNCTSPILAGRNTSTYDLL